ncbi:hypothetical protein [Erythrobacter sp. SG61-1L]|uniref:hypothetical protein n=1 Tax=Erythrobacter sp. SG61-1L TaxID=1603897 RepID=UPI000A832E5B|nr:hypothetical protein [Erythrobacter sp. SG61-1L]
MRALLAFAGGMLAFVAMPAAAQSMCDRECLNGVAAEYLQAVASRAPASLTVAADVRYTENGQALTLHDGLWQTADRLGEYRIVVPDVRRQEVGLFAQVIESGQPALLAARIRLDGQVISEIEAVVSRKDPNGMGKQEAVKVRPGFLEKLKESEKIPRARMLEVADSYFVGLERMTDTLTPFDDACLRIENGMQTTSTDGIAEGIPQMNCKEQFATGFSKFITGLRDRRYLVDEQTGVVMAMLFFDHNGTVKSVPLSDGTTMQVPAPFDRPYTFQIFELFKVTGGKIREVEAVLNTVPYGMASGW